MKNILYQQRPHEPIQIACVSMNDYDIHLISTTVVSNHFLTPPLALECLGFCRPPILGSRLKLADYCKL